MSSLPIILRENLGVFFLLLAVSFCFSQQEVVGYVFDSESNPVPGATITVKERENLGVSSGFDGTFILRLPQGRYTLQIRYVGFTTQEISIVINSDPLEPLRINLIPAVEELRDVVVTGKTAAKRTKEKAFEVEVLETKALKNSSVDINAVLTTIPGVNVRQQGGLGSAFDFSLNGLSGKQVKFFIDGIPLENFGSSLSLNNFPATLIERAEVYKGVVPIYLGADALGGAVNIITNQRKNDFLDISYDIGSFNTHRATLNGQYVTKKGFTFSISSYYNYSDNDYSINKVDLGVDGFVIRDELGNPTGEVVDEVKRFHDAYSSQMINVKTGWVDQKFADRLLFGLLASANENEIQHPLDPSNPFGEVVSENNVLSGNVDFKKQLSDKVGINIYASVSRNREKVIDTSSRRYDWFGDFVERTDRTLGEFEANKTLFTFNDNLHLINTLVNYRFNKQHTLQFNYSKNYIRRKGEDAARSGRIAFQDPHIVSKNILGVSYDLSLLDDKWNSSFFTKGYLLRSEGIIEDVFINDEEDRFTPFENKLEELGYGFASTYIVSDQFQIKSSFEKTYRIPEGFELFGDGFLLKSNPELLPEASYNVNLGALLNTTMGKFAMKADTNVFLRESENFIAIRSEGIFSRYYNTADARSTGIEGEIRTLFNNRFYLDVNATYQNIIDRRVGENTGADFLRNQRIANIPYLFGNASLGAKLDNILSDTDLFTISWSTFYVDEYPLQSFVEGSPEARFLIPEQFSHNLQLGYSFDEGKYNLSVLARNITDARIFDNFLIQQPGRALYVKLRYYITN